MPTPIFCCGFECGVLTTTAHWNTDSSAPTISTAIVRSGARALLLNADRVVNRSLLGTFAAGTISVHRFYAYHTTLGAFASFVYAVGATTSAAIGLQNNASSQFFAQAPGGTAGALFTPPLNVWNLYDIKIDLTTNGNAGATVTVALNRVEVSTSTSTSVTSDGNLYISAGPNTECYIDDVLVSLTGADYPLSDGYIHHFVPTADGTHNIAGTGDFQRTLTGTDILNATTTAFQLVDEVPLEATVTDYINMLAPINATDYVECIFGPAPGIPTPRNAPRAVEVICGINQAGTGAGNMEIRLNDNGTTNAVYSATAVAGVAVATGQQFKRKHYAAGPAGAWVIGGGGNGDFTDLRIRFGSPAALDVNPDQYFGCAMIEADFPYKSMPPPLQVPRFIPRRRVK